MKKLTLYSSILVLSLMLSSCTAIADIFKAGMGFGIFLVVLVIGVILYFVMKGRNRP